MRGIKAYYRLMLTFECEEVFIIGLQLAWRGCLYLHPNPEKPRR